MSRRPLIRRGLVIASAAVIGLGLAACSGGSSSSGTTSAAAGGGSAATSAGGSGGAAAGCSKPIGVSVADQADDLAVRHGEIDRLQHGHTRVALHQPVRDEARRRSSAVRHDMAPVIGEVDGRWDRSGGCARTGRASSGPGAFNQPADLASGP